MNKAVKYALAQLGKGYRYGATGPGQFDCSGLTMKALAENGIRVPHQSGQQAETLGVVAPTKANKRALLPGDLVFWYGSWKHPSSISHVGIYVGRSGPFWMCVAAVDERYGVRKHRMNWALKPSGFAFVGHH